MKRRKFIGIIISVFSLSYFTYLVIDDFRQVVKRIILEDVSSLRIDPKMIDQFLVEAEQEGFLLQFTRIKRVLIIIHYKLSIISTLIPYSDKYYQYRSIISGQFLLSTNIFNTVPYKRTNITYVNFFNPVKMACSNKFSDIYYPQPEK